MLIRIVYLSISIIYVNRNVNATTISYERLAFNFGLRYGEFR